MNKRRWKMAAVVSVWILSAAAGTTYSYLTSQDKTDNVFDAARVDTPVQENFPDPGPVTPGTRIIKSPKLVNDSDVPCYARMKVVFTNDDARDQCEPLLINNGWTEKADGYYYWKDAIPVGEDTAALFDFIKVKADVDPVDLIPFDVLVYGESTASDGKNSEEAWAAMDCRTEG